MPDAEAIPLPHTSATFAPLGRRREHASVVTLSARVASAKRFSRSVRSWPSTTRTGTRSPMPAISHHALALDALARGRTVEHEHEHLLLVDAGTVLVSRGGEIAHDRRAAGRERERGLAAEARAVAGACFGLQREGAAGARTEVGVEVVDPGLVVDPAPRAGGRARDVERQPELRVAEVDHRVAERGAHLPHRRDFALRRELADGRGLADRGGGGTGVADRRGRMPRSQCTHDRDQRPRPDS